MAYRAQIGGVFGSGLYPHQRSSNGASDVIDAVTRGATTLIQGAYQRAQQKRQQGIQDQELARQDRAEQREVENQEFERGMKTRAEARETEAQARADAAAGYTPAHEETKDVVEPGAVQSNGLFGAPGSVTAPKVTQQKVSIAGALDYTKSNAYRARAQTDALKEKDRAEHVTDSEAIHNSNRTYDVAHPLPSRARTGAGATDQASVHASTAVRAQLGEVNSRVKTLQTQRAKLAPEQLKQDVAPAAAIDAELKTLTARRDSLAGVNDQISGKLTAEAGVPRGGTINSALAGKKATAAKTTITKDEAKALRARGFSDKQIASKYLIQ